MEKVSSHPTCSSLPGQFPQKLTGSLSLGARHYRESQLHGLSKAAGLLVFEADGHRLAAQGAEPRRQQEADRRKRRGRRHEEGKLQISNTNSDLTALV